MSWTVQKRPCDSDDNNNNRSVLFCTSSSSWNVQWTINHKREKAYREGRASQRRALTTQWRRASSTDPREWQWTPVLVVVLVDQCKWGDHDHTHNCRKRKAVLVAFKSIYLWGSTKKCQSISSLTSSALHNRIDGLSQRVSHISCQCLRKDVDMNDNLAF